MSRAERFDDREAAAPFDRSAAFADFEERCSACGERTPHDVSIEILAESRKRENAEFSREPYRITECLVCGESNSQRMNNA